MARALLFICALLVGSASGAGFVGVPAPSAAHAQAVPGSPPDGGAPRVAVRVVRPAEGSLRRGALPVPDWAVVSFGVLVLLASAGILAWRIKRGRR